MTHIQATVELTMQQAEEQIRAALADQGFGILTEMNVAEILANKIGVQRPPLKILGACNPNFAHQALELDPDVATMLPCNVVLASISETSTRISMADPAKMMDGPDFEDITHDVAAKLMAALDTVVASIS